MKVRIKTEEELKELGWVYDPDWEAVEKEGHDALFDHQVIAMIPDNRIMNLRRITSGYAASNFENLEGEPMLFDKEWVEILDESDGH